MGVLNKRGDERNIGYKTLWYLKVSYKLWEMALA